MRLTQPLTKQFVAGPWSQVPTRSTNGAQPAAARWRHIATEVLALLVAGASPLWRSTVLPSGDDRLLLVVVVLAWGILAALPERRVLVRLVIPVLATLVLIGPEGKWLAAWTGASILLSDVVVRRRRPLPNLPPPPPATIVPVVGLLAAAAYLGRTELAVQPPLVAVAAACGVTALATLFPGPFRAVGDAARPPVTRLAHATAGLLWSILGAAVVAVPWVWQQIVRIDPLTRRGRGGGPGWLPRVRRTVPAQRRSTVDAVPRSRRPFLALRESAFAAIVLLLMGTLAVRAVDRATSPPPAPSRAIPSPFGQLDPTISKLRGGSWVPEYDKDNIWSLSPTTAWRPLQLYRYWDFHTRYVNARDGYRVGWTPPPCDDCKTLHVWIYGGSTTYGIGQRDQHTIASELARLAWAEGYRVEVSNRGIVAQVHWEEADRLALDLTVDQPPDLVLFYDGVNDLWLARQLETHNLLGWPGAIDPGSVDAETDKAASAAPIPAKPSTADLAPVATERRLTPTQIGRLADEVYRHSREKSLAIARTRGIRARYFWQASRYDRPIVPPEQRNDTPIGRDTAEMYRSAAAGLPDGVVNLRSMFDDVDAPIFIDEVHTNELGSRLVAEAMFREIRGDLDRLS